MERRLINADEAYKYLGMSRKLARPLLEEIGALRRFGRRVLFDRVVIDRWLDEGGKNGRGVN